MKNDTELNNSTIHNENNILKHQEIYSLVKSKVGLKEDVEYQRLYNPDDLWGESLGYLAMRNFKRYVAVLYHLIKEENRNFDLIIGAGDSGMAMAKISEIVYQQLGIPSPQKVNLPIVRFSYTKITYPGQNLNLFDNSVLVPTIKDEIKGLEKLENILLVDDEIKNGITAREAVKVVLDAADPEIKAPHTNITIVAEDQGFKPGNFMNNTTAEIYPFAEFVKDMYGVINYIIPWSIEKQMKEHFSEDQMGIKARLNALLDLPVKETYEIDGMTLPKAILSKKKLELATKEIPNFASLQNQFRQHITKLVGEAIEEYKAA